MREFEIAMGGLSREVRGSTVAPIRARVDPTGFGRSTDRGPLADLSSVADDLTEDVRVVLGQSKAHHDRSAVHPSFMGQEPPSSKLEGSVWRLRQAQTDFLREAGHQCSRLAAREEEVASLRAEEQELKCEVSVRQQEVGATNREAEGLSTAQKRVPAAQTSEPEWRWVPTRLESKLAELSELRGEMQERLGRLSGHTSRREAPTRLSGRAASVENLWPPDSARAVGSTKKSGGEESTCEFQTRYEPSALGSSVSIASTSRARVACLGSAGSGDVDDSRGLEAHFDQLRRLQVRTQGQLDARRSAASDTRPEPPDASPTSSRTARPRRQFLDAHLPGTRPLSSASRTVSAPSFLCSPVPCHATSAEASFSPCSWNVEGSVLAERSPVTSSAVVRGSLHGLSKATLDAVRQRRGLRVAGH